MGPLHGIRIIEFAALGPAPMGTMIRQHWWIPAGLSSKLVADGAPVRTRWDPMPYSPIHERDICAQVEALLGAASVPATIVPPSDTALAMFRATATMSVSSSKIVGHAVPSPSTLYFRPMSKSISASN